MTCCSYMCDAQVKVQTSPHGTFPTSFGPALAQMQANAAETRFPFGSLVPLWARQIPYTITKFLMFEKIVEAMYTLVFTQPKDSYDKPTQLGITFASGYLAGIGTYSFTTSTTAVQWYWRAFLADWNQIWQTHEHQYFTLLPLCTKQGVPLCLIRRIL